MSISTHAAFERVEQQQAFVGLLARPQLTADLDPALYRLATRHRRRLERWAARLGYRISCIGNTFRLRRTPLTGGVAVPAGPVPSRRELVLALVVAATLEDVRTDTVDIQTISDAAHATTAVQGLPGYDPVRRADRKLLVGALSRLGDHGVLRRRTRDELLASWEESGQGKGAGYVINRHALLQFVDPVDLAAAHPADPDELAPDSAEQGDRAGRADPGEHAEPDLRAKTLLRQLVETQALRIDKLSVAELDYWRRQRSPLVRQVVEMTGGAVEVRSDAAVLILPPESPATRLASIDFPSAKAAHWVALHLIDAAARQLGSSGTGEQRWLDADVCRASEDVHRRFSERLPLDLRPSPDRVRDAAAPVLIEAGLLQVADDGAWLLSPLAARYRDADLQAAAAPPAALDEDFE